MSDRDQQSVTLQYRPLSGPRRRVRFEPAEPSRLTPEAYCYWRIDEVYSVEQAAWREVGRERTDEPELTLDVDDAVTADTGVSPDA